MARGRGETFFIMTCFFSNLFVHLFLINSVKYYQFIIIDNSKISYTGIYVFIKSSQFVNYNLKIHVKIIKKFIFIFYFFYFFDIRNVYFSTNLVLGILLKVIKAA